MQPLKNKIKSYLIFNIFSVTGYMTPWLVFGALILKTT